MLSYGKATKAAFPPASQWVKACTSDTDVFILIVCSDSKAHKAPVFLAGCPRRGVGVSKSCVTNQCVLLFRCHRNVNTGNKWTHLKTSPKKKGKGKRENQYLFLRLAQIQLGSSWCDFHSWAAALRAAVIYSSRFSNEEEVAICRAINTEAVGGAPRRKIALLLQLKLHLGITADRGKVSRKTQRWG